MKKKPKFLRLGYTQYSKLGLRRKNKQKYRRAKGGENKVRLKMKGHLRNVSIGFRSEKKTRGLIKGLKPVAVKSIEDLKNLKKDQIAIISKMGNRKRFEIAGYALKNNIRLSNLNSKKFLEKIENEIKMRKDMKFKKSEKKKIRDKKAKESAEKKEEEKKEIKEEIKEEKAEDKKETTENAVKNYETNVKENVEEIKWMIKKWWASKR